MLVKNGVPLAADAEGCLSCISYSSQSLYGQKCN